MPALTSPMPKSPNRLPRFIRTKWRRHGVWRRPFVMPALCRAPRLCQQAGDKDVDAGTTPCHDAIEAPHASRSTLLSSPLSNRYGLLRHPLTLAWLIGTCSFPLITTVNKVSAALLSSERLPYIVDFSGRGRKRDRGLVEFGNRDGGTGLRRCRDHEHPPLLEADSAPGNVVLPLPHRRTTSAKLVAD